MILTPHLLVGAALGSEIQNFGIIFILSSILHFVFDALPHWEYGQKYKFSVSDKKNFFFFILQALLDIFIGLTIVTFILWPGTFNLYIIAGIFFSLLPDGLVLLYFLWSIINKKEENFLKKYYDFHKKIHFSNKKNALFSGIIIEGLIFFLSLYLFFY